MRTRSGLLLLAATLLSGPATAALLAPDSPTLTEIAVPVHGVASVLVPFTGILLVHGRRVVPPAVAIALVTGLVANLACVLVSGELRADVLLGGLIVQLLSQAVGLGFGVLCRRRWTAMVADVVVPLGLWLLLGPAPQAWLTPYGAATRLLTGEAGWPAVVAIALWGVLFPAVAVTIRPQWRRY